MKCQKCQNRIFPEDKYCSQCGNEVDTPQKRADSVSKYFVDSLSAPRLKDFESKESGSGWISFQDYINIDFSKFKSLPARKILFLIVAISFGYVGVSYAFPRFQDFRAVNSAISKAEELKTKKEYDKALASLADISGKWSLPSDKKRATQLRKELRMEAENQKKFEQALTEKKKGNLESAANILSQINPKFSDYKLAQNKLNEIKKLIKKKKEEEKPEEESSRSSKFEIGDYVKTTGNLSVRDRPSTEAEVLDIIPKGGKGDVVGGPRKSNEIWWWKVEYENGQKGWSAESYLTDARDLPPIQNDFSKGQKVQTTTDLNVRNKPNVSASRVTRESQGSTGTIVGGPKFNSNLWWYQVRYESGYTGWSAAQFLEPTEQNQKTDNSKKTEEKNLSYQEKVSKLFSDVEILGAELHADIQNLINNKNFSEFDFSSKESKINSLRERTKKLKNNSEESDRIPMLLEAALIKYKRSLDKIETAETEYRRQNTDESYMNGFLKKAKLDVTNGTSDYIDKARKFLE